MSTAISLDAKTDTYHDVEKMLQKLAWRATKKWGGDYEEYLSAANEGFADAYEDYDVGRGAAFSTWCYWKVIGQITTMVCPRKIEGMTVNAGEDIDLDVHRARSNFDLGLFMSFISQDAKQVVNLIVNSPFDFLDIIDHMDGPECIRCGLVQQLKDANWTMARIIESFVELKDAI